MNYDFIIQGINVIQKIVFILGCGFAAWGAINLLEGYGNDNPGAKSQGIKQFLSGGGIVIIAIVLFPLMKNLFTN